jgi:hypothetical protein
MLRHTVRTAAACAALAALSACAATPYAYPPPMAGGPPIGPIQPGPRLDPEDAPRILRDRPPLQCVPFAREVSGVAIWGDAHTWWAQAEGRYARARTPEPGAVLVLHSYAGPNRGHVAVVTAVISAREIRIDQANWLNTGEVMVRVPVIDVSPANDWSEVRVWHIPTGAWGARRYPAHGFILPRPAWADAVS